MTPGGDVKPRGRVLVTGADGFIGRTLWNTLAGAGYSVRGAVRATSSAGDGDLYAVGDIGPETDWTAALEDVEYVVHLAARTHVVRERVKESAGEFFRVNVEGTERLARMAARRGVRRFVHVSSAGVYGEENVARPFTESDDPRPYNPYTTSKWEAEQRLRRIAGASALEAVTLRPPLVYGPGVKANFLSLMELVDRGLPLPLASVDNRRSLIYVANLADAIAMCLDHPRAVGKTFLVSDGEDVSTPELIRRIARALEKPARLFPFPPSLLRAAGRMIGRSDRVEKLLGSLAIDDSETGRVLGWRPPYSMDHGLRETGVWFSKSRRV